MHTPTLTVGAGRRVVRASLAMIAEGDAGLAMSCALDRVEFGPTTINTERGSIRGRVPEHRRAQQCSMAARLSAALRRRWRGGLGATPASP